MNYAIIRNVKYKSENLNLAGRHNERKNHNYSNKDIIQELTYQNYHLKEPSQSYQKEFETIRKENNLKGQIKTCSNIACEYVITSSKEFFDEIGEAETKRYFETAYDFVGEYKCLGKKNIISAVVHMDEKTPHMHLVFIPVVHTFDKKGQAIDKIACSEFWQAKDSYRELQDAFYDYMVEHDFVLARGHPSDRDNLSVKNYKELTNYAETKAIVKDMTLELPNTPEIKDVKKISFNRDEKIQEQIIKPRDELIDKLHKENLSMKKEITKQIKLVDKAENLECELDNAIFKSKNLEKRCNELENENKKLNKKLVQFEKVFNKIKYTVKIFVKWVCKKLSAPSEEEIIHKFEKDCNVKLDFEKELNPTLTEKKALKINIER